MTEIIVTFEKRECGGWLPGEIWLKLAGLTSRLKLAFYDFFAG